MNGSLGGRSASSRFQQSQRGPFLTTFAVEPGDDVDVEAAFDSFVAAASSCTEFTVEDETGQAVYRTDPSAIRSIGDEDFAVVMTVDAGAQTVYRVIAVSRSDDVLIGVSEVAFQNPPDIDAVEDLLETMPGRI